MTHLNVRGVRLELHPAGDYVSDRIRETGDFYEANILDAVAPRIAYGRLVDVGAMIGNHTAYLAAFVPHTYIHAWEPYPDNLDLLHANVAPWAGRSVVIHPEALGDYFGRGFMRAEADNLGHARLVDRGAGPVEVTVDRLDLYAFRDVTFLKIDAEGSEPAVLAGARETIEQCRPLILIEDWQQGYGALLPAGYRVVEAWPDQQTSLYEWETT